MKRRHIVSLSHRRRRGERGAVLIHVAVALVGLLAFSMLVIDYGVMWAARNQAQNAADAAALAAAVSLAYYDPDDIPRAKAAAIAAGQANLVWGQAPDITEADVIIPWECPPGAPGLPDTCVRVNVYRNRGRDPLPVYFAPLVGITEQGVQAMAVAQVLATNASDCVKPFAIPDKWIERRDADGNFLPKEWAWSDTFDRYSTKKPFGELDTPDRIDEYVPPDPAPAGLPGSGFTLDADAGTEVVLKWGNPHDTINPGWYFPVDLPRPGEPLPGGDNYRDNIATCNGVPIRPGDVLQMEPGGMVGPTVQGIEELIAPDPSYWDGDGPACPPDSSGCLSRRIVAIPVFDVDKFMLANINGREEFAIVKLMGFFIDGVTSKGEVRGYLVPFQGIYDGGGGQPSSFLRTVALVR